MQSKLGPHSVSIAFVAVSGLCVVSNAHGWGWAFAASVVAALLVELA